MNKQKILFIDTSYFIFYRFYATCNWYGLSQRNKPGYEFYNKNRNRLFEVDVFKEKFIKLVYDNIDKLKNKYDVDYCDMILAKDCPRDQIWRNQYYDSYKSTRDHSNFDKNAFIIFYNEILDSLIEKGMKIIQVENAEADDIICISKNKLRQDYPDIEIIIITNDNDYLQIIDNNTKLHNLKNKDLSERLTEERNLSLELKILLGDVSDNIKPVFAKCSKTKAKHLIQNKEELYKLLEKDEESKKRYENNRMLIDINYIPEDIKEKICNYLETFYTVVS